MKYLQPIFITGALIGLTGCATSNHYALVEPIGPAPGALAQNSEDGVLQVYSARQPAHIDPNYAVFFQGSSALKHLAYLPAHTDYSIYDAAGRLIRHVQNSTALGDANPAQVALPSGRYQVRAEAETGDGDLATISLPVIIESSRTTMVYLDGGITAPPPGSQRNELVSLPNGYIAGWRADLSELRTASSPSGDAEMPEAVGGAE
jgi:hypothetical protein